MVDGSLNQVSKAIGSLESSVESLRQQWWQQDRAATEGRRELYRKMDELGKNVTVLQSDVGSLKEDVAAMKPALDAGQAVIWQGIGIRRLVRTLGYILAALLGAFSNTISGWFHK